MAVRFELEKIVKLLLENGADPNMIRDSNKTPIIFYAVYSRNEAIVRILMENNTNPNVKDEGKNTALFCAIYFDEKIVKLLLEYGADPNVKNNHEWTPMHYAIHFDNENIMKILLEHGADPNFCDNEQRTPLFKTNLAESKIKILTDHGANIHHKCQLTCKQTCRKIFISSNKS